MNEEQNHIGLFVLEFLGEAYTAHSGSDVKSRVQKIFSNAVTFHIPTEQRKDFRRFALLSKVSLRCFCLIEKYTVLQRNTPSYKLLPPKWYISAPFGNFFKKDVDKIYIGVYNKNIT
jgi:hypothetical protein